MDVVQKLQSLGQSAQHDLCNSCGTHESRKQDALGRWIYPAALPNGGTVRLLKVLLTNACEKNCYYCGTRAGRDVPRTTFRPEELARAFDQMQRAGLVEGLFLSSAVCGGAERSMDPMLACVELLRQQHAFTGYVHLKILPGASEAYIERALQLAHRVSVNLEAPSPERLARIAPHKAFYDELTRPMRIVKRLLDEAQEQGGSPNDRPRPQASALRPRSATSAHRAGNPQSTFDPVNVRKPVNPVEPALAPGGQTTQFVVGAAGESDQEILAATDRLYRELGLARAYYSAFQPVPGTPLDGVPPAPAWREHRLYQADWLLRFYGFDFDDLVFDAGGCLPRQADPKAVYASRHPERYPVEINRAPRRDLLRVPGLGPKSVERLLRFRNEGTLRELEDLLRAGADARRAAPYILLAGHRPPFQLPLWDMEVSARQTGR